MAIGKHAKRCGIVLAALMSLGAVSAQAAAPYETYSYSYEGDVQISPNAFTPEVKIAQFGEGEVFAEPADMIVDSRNRVIVADKGNNRIVILDENFELLHIIDGYTDEDGSAQTFLNPQGVYATADGSLYVADTDNSRIVVFDGDYQYKFTIDPPSADILPENFKYNPKAVGVDNAGRLYVVSQNTNMGVIVLDKDGSFQGFIGAQRVEPNFAELIRRMFMTEEQISRTASFVPVEYSNLTMDEKGFAYVTCSSIDRYTLYNTIWSRSTDSSYAPVKKINPSGTDVLRRNGFFPPAGDINFSAYADEDLPSPSSITEVCLFKDGMYTLVDSAYNKIFTYDSYGNLLYAFGGTGEALGLYRQLAAVAYLGDKLLALDTLDGSITVHTVTSYGEKLHEVIRLQENREFDKAREGWNDIISLNNNFDMAYLGIGKTLLEEGDYKQAMEYFRLINNQSYYSKAYKLYRGEIMSKYGMPVLAGVIVLIVLVVLWFGYAKKYNNRPRPRGEKRTLREELMYCFHILFHPFDGFWDLKHEKRGSARAATVLLIIAVLSSLYKDIGAGYLTKTPGNSVSILSSIGNILIPFVLWCAANWCLTSLMDGKGSMKDIYVATSYALVPMILFQIPVTLIGNFLVTEELGILSFAMNIGFFWTGLLIFFGSMITHEYSLGKNILVCLLTILGIAIILFLVMIFFSLSGQMVELVNNVINEISFRS